MECDAIPPSVRTCIGAIAQGMGLVAVISVAAAFLFPQPFPAMLAFITSTLIIKYSAAPIGIGPGLHTTYVLLLACLAPGITLFLFGLFDTLCRYAERVSRFLALMEEKAKQPAIFSKNDISRLPPCLLTPRVCVCPPVSCALAWFRDHESFLIRGGSRTVTVILILATPGLLIVIYH